MDRRQMYAGWKDDTASLAVNSVDRASPIGKRAATLMHANTALSNDLTTTKRPTPKP